MRNTSFAHATVAILVIVVGSRMAGSAAAAPPAYYVTDLGTFGGTDSYTWDLNARGQVVGYATTAAEDVRAFLWAPSKLNGTAGTMHDLGTLGGTYAWGVGLNAHGQVAGVSATSEDAAEHATLWNPTTPGGTSGTLHDLGTLGGTYSQGNAVNSSGQVAGFSDVTGNAASHAFMWKPTVPGGSSGTMYDLGSLGGPFTIAWDINSRGQVAGNSDTTQVTGDFAHAFLWQPNTPGGTTGTLHDLGTLGGSWSDGSGINDAGQIAGSASTTDDAAAHAFRWTPSIPGGISGAMVDLGTLGGLNSYGYAMNAAGQVVGMSEVDPQVSNYAHAFLHAGANGMVDLNSRIDALSGWELLDAAAINDAGQIAGQGLIDGEYHAFLLTPANPGDVNRDQRVDLVDVQVVGLNWGSTGPTGDANGDGIVNLVDVQVVGLNWGFSAAGSATAVPEPSTGVIATFAMLALVGASIGRRMHWKT